MNICYNEETVFDEFMAEVSKESKKLWDKYDKLSENNKRRFLLFVEPLIREGGIQGFINQMNLLFDTGKMLAVT